MSLHAVSIAEPIESHLAGLGTPVQKIEYVTKVRPACEIGLLVQMPSTLFASGAARSSLARPSRKPRVLQNA